MTQSADNPWDLTGWDPFNTSSGGGGAMPPQFGGAGGIGWGTPLGVQPGQSWPDPAIPGFLPAEFGSWGDWFTQGTNGSPGGFGVPNTGGNNMSWLGSLIGTLAGVPGAGTRSNSGTVIGANGQPISNTGTPVAQQPFSWQSLIPLGIGLGGGLLGSALSGPSGQQKSALDASTALSGQLAANARQGSQMSTIYGSLGLPAVGSALDYWNKILSGDRTAMSTALGPEISQAGRDSANAFDTASEFAPRGGARTSVLANIPYDNAGKVTSMFQTLRPAAADQVKGIGLALSDLSNTSLGGSSSAASGAANNYLNLVATMQQLRNNQQATAASIGSGLYTWAKGIDWSKLFGGSGTGG